MSYLYEIGAIRWKRYAGQGDVRCHRPSKGWSADAMQLDEHPITGKPLRNAPQWWIREEFQGAES